MSDAFEAERLRILEKVSSGELTPQEGSLQIAMLKVKHQEEAAPAPDAETTGLQEASAAWQSEETFRERINWRVGASDLRLTWPMIALLAIPVLIVAGMGLSMVAVVLALPTLAIVLVWNLIAASAAGALPTLSFFPTLAVVVLLAIAWSFVRGWWRSRLLLNLTGRGR